MSRSSNDPELKSSERLAFELFLRTGRRLVRAAQRERKFNPYHDPSNGQFTFAPGGPKSIADAIFSNRRGLWKRKRESEASESDRSAAGATEASLNAREARDLNKPMEARFELAGGGRGPRRGGGRNGRRPTDPMLLDEVFPGLARSPAGSIIRLADGVLDLSGAANEVTREIHDARVRRLIAQIRAIDPDYDFETLGQAQTIEGRANEIKTLRFQRALAFYRKRDDLRPLQVEVVKIMQDRADVAYDEAVELYDAGRLMPRLSREEAIGNYIDGAVRADLRRVFNANRVDISRGQPVRVVGREYNTSGDERTYRVPDARVGKVAFDVTLTAKTLGTTQVRGFFDADFRPDAVIIIRPSQLGGNYTYAIKRPGGIA